MKKLPFFLAIFSLFLLLSALVVWQTIKQNGDEIQIIENVNLKMKNDSAKLKILSLDPRFRGDDKEGSDSGESEGSVLSEESDTDISKLSVNEASLEELDTVPGVGIVTSQKIIDGRPWVDLEEALGLINKRYREQAREKIRL
jgi:DNA uptake protein ComE-like DNA-binding protein